MRGRNSESRSEGKEQERNVTIQHGLFIPEAQIVYKESKLITSRQRDTVTTSPVQTNHLELVAGR